MRDLIDLFEMTNLRAERTGLPYMVFVSPRGGARHAARIKMKLRNQYGVVSVDPVEVIYGDIPAPAFADIKRWIELNRDQLIRIWNSHDMDSIDIIDALTPLR